MASAYKRWDLNSSIQCSISFVSDFDITDCPDLWEFGLSNCKMFSVASIRRHIDKHILSSQDELVRWNKSPPIKINIHLRRLPMDRLPTRFKLDIHGVDLNSLRCPICDGAIETS